MVVVVLVANAELARVTVSVAVAEEDDDPAPPLRVDDVLSFLRRRGAPLPRAACR